MLRCPPTRRLTILDGAGYPPHVNSGSPLVGTLFKIAIAITAFVLIVRGGLAILRGLAHPIPEPPPAGELRKVKIMYRCAICGAEVRMTIAPNEDPDPPRHCQDEMDLVAPTIE